MARDKHNEGETQVEGEAAAATEGTATATEGTAAVVETKADERFKFVPRPGTDPVEQVKRKDYILELWTGKVTINNPEGKKWNRGPIAKHLTAITGKPVPYQIVFAATKGTPGGSPKEEVAVPATTPPVAGEQPQG